VIQRPSIDRRRALLVAAILGLLVVVPALGVALGGPPGLFRAVMVGALAAFPATIRIGPRDGFLATLAAVGSALVALSLPPFVPVIALWMAILGVAAGLATGRGRQPVLLGAPIAVAFVLASEAASGGPVAWLPVLAGTLVGGLWFTAAAALILRGRTGTGVPVAPGPVAVRYAAALGISLFAAGWLIAAAGDGHGYWLVSAIVAVFQPDPVATRRIGFTRVIATVAGAVAGVALVLADLPPGLLVLVVFAAAAIALYELLGGHSTGRAWITLAIVAMGGQADGSTDVAFVRVTATVVAVLLVLMAIRLVPVLPGDGSPGAEGRREDPAA